MVKEILKSDLLTNSEKESLKAFKGKEIQNSDVQDLKNLYSNGKLSEAALVTGICYFVQEKGHLDLGALYTILSKSNYLIPYQEDKNSYWTYYLSTTQFLIRFGAPEKAIKEAENIVEFKDSLTYEVAILGDNFPVKFSTLFLAQYKKYLELKESLKVNSQESTSDGCETNIKQGDTRDSGDGAEAVKKDAVACENESNSAMSYLSYFGHFRNVLSFFGNLLVGNQENNHISNSSNSTNSKM